MGGKLSYLCVQYAYKHHLVRKKMPKLKINEDWIAGFKIALRESTAKGWNVREHRGQARLEVRTSEGMKSAQLLRNNIPFEYAAKDMADILIRVRNIYLNMSDGHSFNSAVDVAAGKAPRLTLDHDWIGAKKDFEEYKKTMGTGIAANTWEKEFEPVVEYAVQLLKDKSAPSNAIQLIEICAKQGLISKRYPYEQLTYELGSRIREQRVRNLASFLKYCVTRKKFPVQWLPPEEFSEFIGRKSIKANLNKNKKASCTDQELINLINSLPTETGQYSHQIVAKKWSNAIKLCSIFGLRPVELKYLIFNKKTDDIYCNYEKRSGNGVTKPRTLEPLFLIDDEGNRHYENIVELFKAGLLELPDACQKDNQAQAEVGDQMRKYLLYKAGWISLKAIMEKRGENLGTYSFRHSYSLRGHNLGIDAGSVATAMGHSLRTHLDSYDYAKKETTKKAFNKARERASIL